jgi:hypothetical protein
LTARKDVVDNLVFAVVQGLLWGNDVSVLCPVCERTQRVYWYDRPAEPNEIACFWCGTSTRFWMDGKKVRRVEVS